MPREKPISKLLPTDDLAPGGFVPYVDPPTRANPNPKTRGVSVDHIRGYDNKALNQRDWFINALTGDDRDRGDSPSTALKTYGQLARRWGHWGRLYTDYDSNLGCRPVFVNVMSDLPEQDVISSRMILGFDTSLFYLGGVAEVVRAGSITAVVAEDRAANQTLNITDSAVPAGFWADKAGHRVRITSGVRAGALFYIATALGPQTFRASAAARPDDLTEWGYPPMVGVFGDLDYFVPQVGDTYVVERMRRFNLANMKIHAEGYTENEGSFSQGVNFAELDSTSVDWASTSQSSLDLNCGFDFVACRIALAHIRTTAVGNSFSNCALISDNHIDAPSARVHGGLVMGPFTNRTFFLACHNTTENWTVTGTLLSNVLFQNARPTGNFEIHSAGIFDCKASASHSPGGHALVITRNTRVIDAGAYGSPTNPALWGSGNAGAGVYVDAGASLTFPSNAAMSLTGGGGPIQLAGATQARAWDETANGNAGGYSSLRALTWSNMSATIAAGGFGGNAHNVGKRASVITR